MYLPLPAAAAKLTGHKQGAVQRCISLADSCLVPLLM